VQGGRSAAEQEDDEQTVDRAFGSDVAGVAGRLQRQHPEGRIGRQQRHDRQPEQPVGGGPLAAATPQPHQHGQHHHIGQRQDDRGQLLVERERRVAGVGDHQELPGHHPEADRDHQGVEQRRDVPASAAGPHQSQQPHRQGDRGGQEAEVGQVGLGAEQQEGVAGADGHEGPADQVPGSAAGRPVTPDPDRDRQGRSVGEDGRGQGGHALGVGQQEVGHGRDQAAGQEASPGRDPHNHLIRHVGRAPDPVGPI
jgi:hypothetical protein